MEIIKVDATTSTNALARVLNKEKPNGSFCVSAEFQTEGRGQQQSIWQSSRSKNLMFTVVFNELKLDVQNQFVLNALVCLAILRVLKNNNIPKVSLKWPNDILSHQYKICGILIENTLSYHQIKSAYIGIGLNVNQHQFENLPKATSMKNIAESGFDRDLLLKELVDELKEIPDEIEMHSIENIINIYKNHLYNYKTKTEFALPNGDSFVGRIKDIASDGKLLVEFPSGKQDYFQHKAITQVY